MNDAVLVARCENELVDLTRSATLIRCDGHLRYRWGQAQAACDTCGAYCGIAVAEWLEVVHGAAQASLGAIAHFHLPREDEALQCVDMDEARAEEDR